MILKYFGQENAAKARGGVHESDQGVAKRSKQ
jgi:hypothetical protein